MEKNTYKLELNCKNCGYSGEVEITKGTLVSEANCPNCGNQSLNKVSPPMRLIPRVTNSR